MSDHDPKNPVAQRWEVRNQDGTIDVLVKVWCSGCKGLHSPRIQAGNSSDGRHVWEFDGNYERPTFSPSILVYSSVHLCPEPHHEVCEDPSCESGHLILNAEGGDIPPEDERILGHNLPHTVDPAWGNCHSFLRAGVWHFLGDCAHALAGRQVPLEPLPDWLVKDR